MPNAADVKETNDKPPTIFVLGEAGVGKTSQFTTLLGKKFAYLFDPNALRSLAGSDIEYEEFLPDKISMHVGSLSKDGKKDTSALQDYQSDVYLQWERDFEDRINRGFFDDISWVGFDSVTTFSDMVMDRVLTLNGRPGAWPMQDDYGPQMNAIQKVVRTLTGLGCGIYMTGHLESVQDKLTQRVQTLPLLTGKLKKRLPLLFSDLLVADVQVVKTGEYRYVVNSKPDMTTKLGRTSLRDMLPVEDVTLDFTRPLLGQGLGRLYRYQRDPNAPKVERPPVVSAGSPAIPRAAVLPRK